MGTRHWMAALLLAAMVGLAGCADTGPQAGDPGLVAGSTHAGGGGGYH